MHSSDLYGLNPSAHNVATAANLFQFKNSGQFVGPLVVAVGTSPPGVPVPAAKTKCNKIWRFFPRFGRLYTKTRHPWAKFEPFFDNKITQPKQTIWSLSQ